MEKSHDASLSAGTRALESAHQTITACVSPVCVAEEYTCLWQECGFCSLESSADLVRHVYFHCYHTKLKQWGLRALQSQSDVSHCQLDFQSRNIIPEIQENFLCLWEYCEVRAARLRACLVLCLYHCEGT